MKRASSLALTLVAASCGEQATVNAPLAAATASVIAPMASASTTARASATALSMRAAPPRTRIPELGVSFVLPPEARGGFDADKGYYFFRLSEEEQGGIERVQAPAPRTEEEAAALWADLDGRRGKRVIEQGGGGLEPWWAVFSFEVRMGVEGRPGMHRLARVTRVYGVLALEGGSHARCSMALEYDAEIGGRLPSVDRAIGTCRSLRPL